MDDNTTVPTNEWGRVDDELNVYVITKDGEREVGQFPDGTKEEAMEFYSKRFADLEAQVGVFISRLEHKTVGRNVAKLFKELQEAIANAKAVGDLDSLTAKLAAVEPEVKEMIKEQQEANKQALQETIQKREEIVLAIEQLAQKDPKTVQWKQTTQKINELFDQWKNEQSNHRRVPSSVTDPLWKRFRTAKNQLESARKEFFSTMESTQKLARKTKQELIEKAKTLDPSDSKAVMAYRNLLNDWKAAGRAGHKIDDELWSQFNAVGDAIFSAKKDIDAQIEKASEEIIAKREEILANAEELLKSKDVEEAKVSLRNFQNQLERAGFVPRHLVKNQEQRLSKIEAYVRGLEQKLWNDSDPEKLERASSATKQLEDTIAALEADLEAAKQGKDKKHIKEIEEAISARKLWLDAISK